MAKSLVKCSVCLKTFFKDNRHINENKKLNHKFYCSIQCQSIFRNKRIKLDCKNPDCRKKFIKRRCEISDNNYCSRSCAVSVNNVRFPKRKAAMRNCNYCDERLILRRRYCSSNCKSNALTVGTEELLDRIRKFYIKHGRVPVKREMGGIYKPARKYFSTWNNAIKAAGFKPNPVLFADRCVANDGHVCDSLAEKLIDDYLYEKGIIHARNIPYPIGDYTFDFKIGNVFVEYFGLAGEHKRYDELRRIKQIIARRSNLQFVEIYPKDLYPHSKLEKILSI